MGKMGRKGEGKGDNQGKSLYIKDTGYWLFSYSKSTLLFCIHIH